MTPEDRLYIHADGDENPWEGIELPLLVLGCAVWAVVAGVRVVARRLE